MYAYMYVRVHVELQPGDTGALIGCWSGQSAGHTAQETVQEHPLLCIFSSRRPALVSK